jgi:hypothetical protein
MKIAHLICFLVFLGNAVADDMDLYQWEETRGEFTAVSKQDSRVVLEAELKVESEDLVPTRTDRFFFIPTAQATAEEKRLNRSLASDMNSHEAHRINWSYDAILVAAEHDVLVNLESEKFEKKEKIQRAAFFRLPYLKNMEADVAGFHFKITWKKPNKTTTDNLRGVAPAVSEP